MKTRQILSANEMRQLDKRTMQQQEITSFELMNRVALAMFEYIISNRWVVQQDHVVIVAGTGNNGGDAMLVGMHLSSMGIQVQLILVGPESNQSTQSKKALAMCKDLQLTRITDNTDSSYIPILEEATLIIDGIFGIGLTRTVEQPHTQIIDAMNRSYATIISIDIPSGIHADNGVKLGTAVHANHTLVVQNLKQGNLLNDAKDFSGENHILDVDIIQSLEYDVQQELQPSYIQGKIPKRRHNSYKYSYGNLLTFGGSKGMMGAPILAGYAALRMGSGLSRIVFNNRYLHLIHNPYPDIMIDTFRGIEEIPQLVQRASTVVFGPGLGKKDAINLDIMSHLLGVSVPLVVDADGLHYLKQLLHGYNERGNIVITPHYKEMADFLGITIEEVRQEPVLYAKNIAHTYNIVVVLKGTCTIITNDEETYFSSNATPGLAKAGSGDVLSGIIGSLMGRGLSTFEAAKIGVLIHSQAGLYAEEIYGEESMTASDIITMLPKVLHYVKS